MEHHLPAHEDATLKALLPEPIYDLVTSRDWEGALGELGQRVFETQMEMHAALQQAETDRLLARRNHVSLYEHTTKRIIELVAEPDNLGPVQDLVSDEVVFRAMFRADTLPYFAFRSLRRASVATRSKDLDGASTTRDKDDGLPDIDEWILKNERVLRDDERVDWKRGLVDWNVHSDFAFDAPLPVRTLEGQSAKVISRPEGLGGYTLLDELRKPHILVQPGVEAFRLAFNAITDGLLNGLDWSNVFVAGGIVLSTLLAVTPTLVNNHVNSDVDLFIYGLGPVEANAKIQHIFDVWKHNLPADAQDSALVVRNSRTITFFARYPLKRLQIVLKLVKHPKQVLLNFDLDVCAMGFDGKSLLMLPRACRALETGYDVFTMDLIHGHYLGDRRASQQSRVFKYADKGYGIRILPSYLAGRMDPAGVHSNLSGPAAQASSSDNASMSEELRIIAEKAVNWTEGIVCGYKKLAESTNRQHRRHAPRAGEDGVLDFTHDMLEDPSREPIEPGDMSCLSGFELLMRHVQLWRLKERGNIRLTREQWASNEYDDLPQDRDEPPPYAWNSDFDTEVFVKNLNLRNRQDDGHFRTCAIELVGWPHRNDAGIMDLGCSRRAVPCGSIEELFSGDNDLCLYFYAARGFVDYANATIRAVLEEHRLPASSVEPLEVVPLPESEERWNEGVEALRWRVDSILGWQHVDRRIDEIFEIIWSFYRSHRWPHHEMSEHARKFYLQVGRRAIRPDPVDEAQLFSRWISKPAPSGWSHFSRLSAAASLRPREMGEGDVVAPHV